MIDSKRDAALGFRPEARQVVTSVCLLSNGTDMVHFSDAVDHSSYAESGELGRRFDRLCHDASEGWIVQTGDQLLVSTVAPYDMSYMIQVIS